MDTPPVEELFARYARAGEAADLAEVFDRTAPELLRVALHLVRDAALAEDLLQGTFLVAIEKQRRYDPARPLVPWLCGILTKQARRARNRAARAPRAPAAQEVAPPDAPLLAREARDTLTSAIARLAEIYREPLQLSFVEGLSPLEIAQLLNRSPGAVRVQLHRGISLLKKLVPPGLALGVLAALPARGLAGIKSAVLAQAGASAAAALGGALLMKKLVTAALLLFAATLAAWLAWPAPELSHPRRGEATANAALPRAGEDPQSRPGDTATRSAVPAGPAMDELAPLPQGALLVRVRHRDDGTPAPGVTVILAQPDGRDPDAYGPRAQTGSDGTALFASVCAGRVDVLVDAEQVHAETDVRAGAANEVLLEVAKLWTCAGVVVDAQGEPVSGAEIWSQSYAPYERTERVGASDGQGKFHLARIPHCALGARAVGRGASWLHQGRADQDGVMRFRLVLDATGGGLHGRVVDAERRPIAGASLTARADGGVVHQELPDGTARSGWSALHFQANAQGEFAVGELAPGPLRINVRARGHAPGTELLAISSGAWTDHTFTLAAGARLEGTVRDPQGRPVAGAFVGATSAEDGARRLRTGQDGRYALDSLPIGEVTFNAGIADHEWVEQRLTLHPGELTRWDPVLRPFPEITGTVVDERGGPVAGVGVAAECMAPVGWCTQRAGSDERGAFRVRVQPDRTWRLRLRSPGARFMAAAHATDVVPSGATDLTLVLHDADRATAYLEGQVAGAQGIPVAPFLIVLEDWPRPTGSDRVRIEEGSGRFRLGPLPAGGYRLTVSGAKFPEACFGTFTLVPHETRDVGKLELGPGGRIRFSYRRSDGAPISHISAQMYGREGRLSQQLSTDPEHPTLTTASASEYLLDVFGDGFVDLIHMPFTVRDGETTELDVVLEPGRRRTVRVPVPAPKDWAKCRSVAVLWKRANGQVVYDDDDAIDLGNPVSRWLSFGLGEYVVTLATDDHRRFEGRFTITSLAPNPKPIDIAVRELR